MSKDTANCCWNNNKNNIDTSHTTIRHDHNNINSNECKEQEQQEQQLHQLLDPHKIAIVLNNYVVTTILVPFLQQQQQHVQDSCRELYTKKYSTASRIMRDAIQLIKACIASTAVEEEEEEDEEQPVPTSNEEVDGHEDNTSSTPAVVGISQERIQQMLHDAFGNINHSSHQHHQCLNNDIALLTSSIQGEVGIQQQQQTTIHDDTLNDYDDDGSNVKKKKSKTNATTVSNTIVTTADVSEQQTTPLLPSLLLPFINMHILSNCSNTTTYPSVVTLLQQQKGQQQQRLPTTTVLLSSSSTHSTSTTTSGSTSTSTTSSSGVIGTDQIPYSDNPITTSTSPLNSSPPLFTLYPMTIDDYKNSNDNNDSNDILLVEYHAIIILYNFAIIHQCMGIIETYCQDSNILNENENWHSSKVNTTTNCHRHSSEVASASNTSTTMTMTTTNKDTNSTITSPTNQACASYKIFCSTLSWINQLVQPFLDSIISIDGDEGDYPNNANTEEEKNTAEDLVSHSSTNQAAGPDTQVSSSIAVDEVNHNQHSNTTNNQYSSKYLQMMILIHYHCMDILDKVVNVMLVDVVAAPQQSQTIQNHDDTNSLLNTNTTNQYYYDYHCTTMNQLISLTSYLELFHPSTMHSNPSYYPNMKDDAQEPRSTSPAA